MKAGEFGGKVLHLAGLEMRLASTETGERRVWVGEMGNPEYMGHTHLVDVKDGFKARNLPKSLNSIVGPAVKRSRIQSRGRALELWGLWVTQKTGRSSRGKRWE